ncbi:MAG: hypothetical protein GY754_20815 [bacterium]|nr:hypothetical protein [bacterium]
MCQLYFELDENLEIKDTQQDDVVKKVEAALEKAVEDDDEKVDIFILPEYSLNFSDNEKRTTLLNFIKDKSKANNMMIVAGSYRKDNRTICPIYIYDKEEGDVKTVEYQKMHYNFAEIEGITEAYPPKGVKGYFLNPNNPGRYYKDSTDQLKEEDLTEKTWGKSKSKYYMRNYTGLDYIYDEDTFVYHIFDTDYGKFAVCLSLDFTRVSQSAEDVAKTFNDLLGDEGVDGIFVSGFAKSLTRTYKLANTLLEKEQGKLKFVAFTNVATYLHKKISTGFAESHDCYHKPVEKSKSKNKHGINIENVYTIEAPWYTLKSPPVETDKNELIKCLNKKAYTSGGTGVFFPFADPREKHKNLEEYSSIKNMDFILDPHKDTLETLNATNRNQWALQYILGVQTKDTSKASHCKNASLFFTNYKNGHRRIRFDSQDKRNYILIFQYSKNNGIDKSYFEFFQWKKNKWGFRYEFMKDDIPSEIHYEIH